MCFMAGANSIFDGDKLLTTANNDRNEDLEMFEQLGLTSRPAFLPYVGGNTSTGAVPADRLRWRHDWVRKRCQKLMTMLSPKQMH